METNYLNISTGLLFLILGLILLFRHSPNKPSNNFLGLFFLLIAGYIEVINFHFHSVRTNNLFHLSYYLPFDALLLMLMSPCIYFYVLLLLNRPVKLIHWRTLLHGLPLVPCVLFNVLFYYWPVDDRINWLIRDFYSGSMEMLLINVVLYLQISFYLFTGYKAIRNQRKISDYVEKNGFRTNISWIGKFLFLNIIVVFVSMPFCFLINNERNSILLGLVVLNIDFIYLFIRAVLKTDIIEPEKMEEKKIPYLMNEEKAVSYWKTLTEYMDSCKPYHDEDCSVHSLAEQTNIPEHHLSNLLHAHAKISFADFINKYRLREAEILLKDKSKYRKTIDTIALECGFGSRSSFYRAFARVYGITPRVYRKQHDKDSGG